MTKSRVRGLSTFHVLKLFGLLLVVSVNLLALLWLVLARPILADPVTFIPKVPVDMDRLQQHVDVITKQFGSRSHRYPERLLNVAHYIQKHLEATGAPVTRQDFQVEDRTYRNIMAEYGPPAGDLVVVGAHYDTFKELPGADDNASGVAGLLALGTLLGESRLQSRIILAAYTLEEPPFFGKAHMGSAIHARSLKDQGLYVKLMICLEMIGFFTEAPDSQNYPNPLLRLFYPSTGNFITIVDRLFSNQARPMKEKMTGVIDVPVYSINAPPFIEGVDFSDHRNFWKEGYPAVMVTDTAFYRNKAYHTAEDIPDRLDYQKMAQVVYGVYDYLRYLSEK